MAAHGDLSPSQGGVLRCGRQAVLWLGMLCVHGALSAQDPASPAVPSTTPTETVPTVTAPAAAAPSAAEAGAPANANLAAQLVARQTLLVGKFQRLESVFLKRAELTAGTDPTRAELLRQAYGRCREKALVSSLDSIKQSLALDQAKGYADALAQQAAMEKELQGLLQLLMSEDRGARIDEEKEALQAFIEKLNKVVRIQQSLRARTERGAAGKELAPKQGKLAEDTQAIADQIAKQRGENQQEGSQGSSPAGKAEDKPDPSKAGDKSNPGSQDEQGSSEDKNGSSESGKEDQQPGAKGEPGNKSEPSDKGKEGESSDSSGKGQSQDGQSAPPSGEQKPGQSGGAGGESSPQPGESGGSEKQQGGQKPPSPTQKRLKEAQERMRQAQKQLDESKQEKAVEEQRAAEQAVDQAIAELEKILRQLREEEMQRTLAQLEARFRRMLLLQTRVWEATVRLNKTPEAERGRDLDAAASRLSKDEQAIALEATRAATLLKEDGTSVAFPETVEQMREDMLLIAQWLGDTKLGQGTQTLEEDVIRTLEELIAAVEVAQEELEKGKSQESEPGEQQDGEDPLLDKIAELKMIRSLQVRINQRTTDLSQEIKTAQQPEELLRAMQVLSERQGKLFRATRDLVLEKNK